MKIALVQFDPVIGDFAGNVGKMLVWLERARAAGCRLAVFPELAVSGYPPQDLLERRAFLDGHNQALGRFAAQVRGIAVVCGVLEPHTGPSGKPLHNSCALIEDGAIRFTAQKRLLPTYDVFDESRYFEPGGRSRTCGFAGRRLSLTVCEDIWNDKDVVGRPLYGIDPVAELMADKKERPDLLINIAASPYCLGKIDTRLAIFSTITRKYGIPLLYCNQVGGQDSLVFDGASLAVDPGGAVAAAAPKFEEAMLVVEWDEASGRLSGPMLAASLLPASEEARAAEVLAALVAGTRDYVRKCGFRQVLLGLSGGIDSAVTAVVAVEALGAENVLGVAMPSMYSSSASLEDARRLAANLGIECVTLPISGLFDAYCDLLQPLFSGRPADVTEQNNQTRSRGNLLMALSNKFGRLLLSTGNKSELAVGYCTLYGDMSGGLAVISDVPKTMVYALARYINREQEVIPARTIERPPSAELAPGQRDEDDLPPYPVLDEILHRYLEENQPVAEIVAAGFAPRVVADVVRRVRRNEYKRKQAPVGLKVTSKAFGYGRRYPTAERFDETEAAS